MPPEPLESSRARGVGPPISRGPHARVRAPHPVRREPRGGTGTLASQVAEAQEASASLEAREAGRAREQRGKESPTRGGPARLEALLTDLGPRVRRGVEPLREPERLHPTGLAALDTLLRGGFPAGAITELSGPASSGRTAIALALLAETTDARCELAALVDAADAFDPPSAEAAGVDLDRLLWARPGGPLEALRCTERLMETGGIPLVLLDLSPASPAALSNAAALSTPTPTRSGRHGRAGRRRHGAGSGARSPAHARPALHHWIRLARLADATGTALVVLSRERLTGAQAAFALETRGFQAEPDRPFDPMAGRIETRVSLVRARGGPTDTSLSLLMETDPDAGP